METTNLIVFSLILTLGVVDAYLVLIKGRASNISQSVSRCLERLGFRSPVFVFVAGAAIGHFWFSMKPDCSEEIKKSKTEEMRVKE